MAQTTPKLGLTKPELTDLITDTIPALAQNMQDIDDKVAPLTGATFTGDIMRTGSNYPSYKWLSNLAGSDELSMFANAGALILRNITDGLNGVEFKLNGTPDVKIDDRTIAAIGSNANGSYVRFYNGLQVCWYDSETVLTTTTATGSLYVSSPFAWTYPVGFTSRPVIIPACRYGGTGAGAWGRVNATPSAGSVSLALLGATNTSTGIPTPVAIGTWF